MRRAIATLSVLGLGLGLAGCGGDDDAGSTPAANDAAAEAPASDAPADGNDGDDGDANNAPSDAIDSLSQIPQACKDLMGDYLRELEPMVSSIDWQNATLADMEAIGPEFEPRAAEFERASEAAGCDNLDFGDDEGFGLIIDFARSEAPGTVGFFEFVESFNGSGTATVGETDDPGDALAIPGGASEFADCAEAIDFLRDITSTYSSMNDMPISELTKFASIGLVLGTCTPEQLAEFESFDLDGFAGG